MNTNTPLPHSPTRWVFALSLVGLVAASAAALVLQPKREATGNSNAAQPAVAARPGDEISKSHQVAISTMRRQRESGGHELYAEAEAALRKAEALAPEDYTTRKLLAWVLAGQHRFDEALEIARACSRQNPHDSFNYGIITDALSETGDYEGAVEAAQKMVDLKPGSESYARAAHQRRLHGDGNGAVELFAMALEAVGPSEKEAKAWIHTQIGDTHLSEGKLARAETAYASALKVFPDYHLAMAGQAQLLMSRGRLQEAAGAWQKLLARTERPDWRALLGDVHLAQGRKHAAEAEYARVDRYLTTHMDEPAVDARHQLAQFLADRGREPKRALAIAEEEAADATDIYACDTLAWARYHAGDVRGAWEASRKALRLGTRDSKLLFHAGMIAAAMPSKREEAVRLLRQAVALNPTWSVLDSAKAKDALAGLQRAARGL